MWNGLEKLPGQVKRYIAENNINFYIIDGVKIGKEIGLGNRINTVLQSAFFSLTKLIPEEEVIKLMKDAATRSYAVAPASIASWFILTTSSPFLA